MTELALSTMRRAFVRGRVKYAAGGALVSAVIAGLGVVFSHDPGRALPFALGVVLMSFLWVLQGQTFERMMLPSLLLGTMPLTCSIAAQYVGHACMHGGCSSLCVPLCTAGGVGAGILMARLAGASAQPVRAWIAGASLIACCGAIGCVCVGASGIVGMAAGLVVTGAVWSGLSWMRRAAR